MNNNENQKSKFNLSKKQSIKIVVGLSILVVVLALLHTIDFDAIVYRMFNKDADTTPEYNFFYYDPDYETDIMTDKEYLELDRTVSYTSGVITRKDVDLDDFDGTAVIKDYLEAMINGDADAYAALFTDEYKSDPKNRIPEKFPQQRLYNISVEMAIEPYTFKQSDLEGKYTGIIRYVFKVSYMIQYNTGTVRKDIDSESMRPITVEVFEYPGADQKINAIVIPR